MRAMAGLMAGDAASASTLPFAVEISGLPERATGWGQASR